MTSFTGSWAVVGRDTGAKVGWRKAMLSKMAFRQASGDSSGAADGLFGLVAHSSPISDQRQPCVKPTKCYS